MTFIDLPTEDQDNLEAGAEDPDSIKASLGN